MWFNIVHIQYIYIIRCPVFSKSSSYSGLFSDRKCCFVDRKCQTKHLKYVSNNIQRQHIRGLIFNSIVLFSSGSGYNSSENNWFESTWKNKLDFYICCRPSASLLKFWSTDFSTLQPQCKDLISQSPALICSVFHLSQSNPIQLKLNSVTDLLSG